MKLPSNNLIYRILMATSKQIKEGRTCEPRESCLGCGQEGEGLHAPLCADNYRFKKK